MPKLCIFSMRKRLEDEFLVWAMINKVKICPLSVITWLVCVKRYEPPKEE